MIRERAARWTRDGLLEDDGVRLRLGEQGLFVSNAVMAELLGSR
jgi:coproporphyrinogen III oxidase-like Fe-S oxidoreductase